ncbi:DUF1361 domain-containing protein [Bacillus rhizoplanae]|uniref:DUF1361 domain-containing protein n=1 Tax=Bacillus TaxID=1386 RepID=UPI003D1EB564
MGRFLRFHSIHLFTGPFSLFIQLLRSLNGDFLQFIVWMSILQLIICGLFLDSRRSNFSLSKITIGVVIFTNLHFYPFVSI